MLSGRITFGRGLGDVLYLIALVVADIILLILVLLSERVASVRYRIYITLTLFVTYLLLALLVTYWITVGRGVEHSWDGNIFI